MRRVTTLSRRTPSNDVRAVILIHTVRRVGEASRKSSSREAWKPSDGLGGKSYETRFGKAKRVEDGINFDLEWKRSTLGFAAWVKMIGGGAVVVSEVSGFLIVRAYRSRGDPELIPENLWMCAQSLHTKSRVVILSLWEGRSAITLMVDNDIQSGPLRTFEESGRVALAI